MRKRNSRWLVVLMCLGSPLNTAMALSESPTPWRDPEVEAIFSPTNGYARGYGVCYGNLQAMRPLRGAFWATDEGKTLIAQADFAHFWHTFDRFSEAPCHLCEYERDSQACRASCDTMKEDMTTDWAAVEQSVEWAAAKKTPALQAVFEGWRVFTTCMQNR